MTFNWQKIDRNPNPRRPAPETPRDKRRLLAPGGAPAGQRQIKSTNTVVRPPPGLTEGRLQLLLGVYVLVFGILVVRAADLTIWQRDHLQAKAEDQHKKKVVVPAHRGRILDRSGRTLAISLPVETIAVEGDRLGQPGTPERKQEAKRLGKKLAKLLDIDRKTLTNKLEAIPKGGFPTLQRKVPPEITKALKESHEPALFYLPEMKRFYPLGEYTAHILGFTDMDGHGVEGMERAMNSRLTGQPGARLITRDRLGRLMPESSELSLAKPGTDLILTVDASIQYIAYRALARAVTKYEAAGGTVIVMDPENGHILAIVNQPGFNPNNLSDSVAAARRNRAITDLYEPGSTFKVFTIAAALDHGTVKPETVINCENGLYRIAGKTIKDHSRHDYLSVSGVLQKSSNIGSAKIGAMLGAHVQEDYLRSFGFAKPTGIELSSEATGRIPDIRHYPVLGLA
ncbi:MAG: penicillin-binding protein 2, partial [Magnetococcales bacterium]|nr:penicillin-binding protein 2 [Magnetococcales bacterium]